MSTQEIRALLKYPGANQPDQGKELLLTNYDPPILKPALWREEASHVETL